MTTSETTSTTKIPIQERLKPDTTIKIVYTSNPQDNPSHHHQDQSSLSSNSSSLAFNSPRFVIGYWSIRGLGAPLRMLLNASGCNHWVVYYDVMEEEDDDGTTKDGGWNKQSWFNDKQWLKQEYNPFINLPFLIDCDKQIVISQTNAIFTYLGRELNMMGSGSTTTTTTTSSTPGSGGSTTTNGTSLWKIEELLCEIMDLRNSMVRFAYVRSSDGKYTSDSNDHDKDQQDANQLITSIQGILDKLELHFEMTTTATASGSDSKSLSSKTCHLVGTTYTVPDFHLWEMLDQYYNLIQFYDLPPLWSSTPTSSSDSKSDGNDDETTTSLLLVQKNKKQKITDDDSNTVLRPYLGSFYVDFANLPENISYVQSNTTFRDLPFNNAYARFGSTPPTVTTTTTTNTTTTTTTVADGGGGSCDTVIYNCGGAKYQRGQPIPWKQRGIIEEIREKVLQTTRECS